MIIKDRTPAEQAYEEWRLQFKVNMQVHTDEQMFCLGYNYRNSLFDALLEIIHEQEQEIDKLKGKPKESQSTVSAEPAPSKPATAKRKTNAKPK